MGEDRAEDLLLRLDELTIGEGLNEEDVYGKDVREPLRTMCTKLATSLLSISSIVPPPDLKLLQRAVSEVCRVASSEEAASNGRLDSALSNVAHALYSSTPTDRLSILEVLVCHLQCARMIAHKQNISVQQGSSSEQKPEDLEVFPVEAQEMSRELNKLADLLGISGQYSSARDLLQVTQHTIENITQQLPASFFLPVLPAGTLTDDQMRVLHDIDASFRPEYSIRRRMLLERAKVTLQSFLWSERLREQGTYEEAASTASSALSGVSEAPEVAPQDVFTATAADLFAVLKKSTSGKGRIDASVKKVLMGSVPDRGGRVNATRKNTMPAWQQRKK